MAYICSEETQELIDAVREFCDNEVREQSKEYDRTGEWPKEIYDKAMEMQLHMMDVPEEYGGLGLDKLSIAAILEEMAKADAGFALTFSVSNIGLKSVFLAGTEAQKKKFCDTIVSGHFTGFALTEPQAGSDAGAGRTTAKKDGDSYILNGRKCFITNAGPAQIYVVFAITDKSKGAKGYSAFIVERDRAGVSVGKEEDKMGIRLSNTADVVFDDVHVPADHLIGKEGKGYGYAMSTLDLARPIIGAMSAGIIRRCIEECVEYAKQRVTFGKPIIKHQVNSFKLADMEIKLETTRAAVINCFNQYYAGKPYGEAAAIAKCYGGDSSVECALEAIQILGGYGYSREYPVEKLLRDAKIMQIYEGTNEIQRMVISGYVCR